MDKQVEELLTRCAENKPTSSFTQDLAGLISAFICLGIQVGFYVGIIVIALKIVF